MISVCIIAKNEEKTIENCLQSLIPYSFEIIVVDTGSTDKTKEIALRYTKHVYDYVWNNDFSAARNYCIQKASNDWILSVDCDECLEPFIYDNLLKLITSNEYSLGTVLIKNISASDSQTTFPAVRLFNKNHFLFHYKIHEQPRPVNPSLQYGIFPTDISFLHSGYNLTKDDALNKYNRNIILLKQALSEGENDEKPYFYYQLAQSYAAIYHQLKLDTDTEIPISHYLVSAKENYEKALSYRISPSSPYYKLLVIQYGDILLSLEKYSEAIFFLESCDASLKTFADYIVLLATLYIHTSDLNKSILLFQKALTLTDCYDEGCNSYICYYYLGTIYKFLKDYDNALHYLNLGLSLDINPNIPYLQKMVESYGYCLLNSGRIPDALCLEGVYDTFAGQADFVFLMGLIYMKNGLYAKAISEFKKSASMYQANNNITNSNSANYNIGVIYECLGNIPDAIIYYKKCRNYPPSAEQLKKINQLTLEEN